MNPQAPFLERLDPAARELLLATARPVSFREGETLVRYGTAVRGAHVLKSGAAEASVVLPGGERIRLARFGPGQMFGEAALIERASASATVRAASAVEGWLVERDSFRALVASRTPAALQLQHAVTLLLVAKLRELNARVLACPSPDDRPLRHLQGADPLAAIERRAHTWFEHRRFLPLLQLFAEFDAEEIDEAVAGAPLLELARGQALFYAGQPSGACYLVVRGALEVWAAAAGKERRLAVTGPGNLVGFMSLVAGGDHGSSAFAREDSVLIELDRARFDALYRGTHSASVKLHRAILGALLGSMNRSNTQFARLIAAARLRGAQGEGDALEAAHASQIVAAEPSPEP
ncbi:MAG TPA: cyclic nucleotide-binding domain-containing protein [Burkholderiales bacterium]|nr:cyclic nucleotide-binding domain-containing protein [Burkholderiales bacterium]